MTSLEFKNLLAANNIKPNTWVSFDENQGIYSINLDSDGNQYMINIYQYYFDTNNDLIRIREYYYKKDPVGKTYTVTPITNKTDCYIDVANVASITLGKAIKEKANPFISFLYQ